MGFQLLPSHGPVNAQGMDKIICVGKNYLKHALELGDPVPTEPTYFLKPPSTLLSLSGSEGRVKLPRHGEIHHELELVFQIEKGPQGLKWKSYTLGLDLTLRDIQSRLKKEGLPWEKAKVFTNAAIVGPWQPLTSLDEVMNMEFTLKVNGQLRQKGRGLEMRYTPDFVLKDAENWWPVCNGDLLFTGTPEGVGPLKPGDRVEVASAKIQFAFDCE
jgi:2-keto-4-pentenoate hydratase/2-oxohepta-3-ene-1,7-dioic acid hydratase in catechol pathway